GRRAHALGFKREDRMMVNYRAPFGAEWTAKRGSLSQVAAVLRADLDDAERYADYIIIDSYTTATSTGDAMGGMAGAQEFFSGVAMLARPVLVIAHVAGGQERFPAKPFGSVFVHNLARETWAVERVGESDETSGSMTLELRNMKANNQPKVAPEFLTFNFAEDGSVSVDREEPAGMTLADQAEAVLSRSINAMTVKDIARMLKADEGRSVTDENLRRVLMRDSVRFSRTAEMPYKWLVRSPSRQS
ncbi:MAG: hypothetical protein M3082_11660, partial [Candidatus Dormibacteraeota bacterium]|nr:hypothetical protein [Candidatus Dormibacteraeota bacterium]